MTSQRPSEAPRLALCLEAIYATAPLAIAVIPWAILTGAITVQIGLDIWQGMAMSLLVFAGAAQLSGMTLISAGASLPAIWGSTLVISSRHILYSLVFRQHVLHLPLPWRLSLAFVLTDEMFVISEAHTKKTGSFSPLYALASGLAFYTVWNLGTLAGILAGDYFDDLDSLGLDFAIAATFIAMTFDQLRRLPVVVAILVSGVASVLLKSIFSDSYIVIAGLLGMLAAYGLNEDFEEEKGEGGQEEGEQ